MTTPEPPMFGGNFTERTPDGDNRSRLVCRDCGFINYQNPKMVVGTVAAWEDRVLLCRRAIEPRKGYWTLPAGYLELHESAVDGAKREAWEEAHARLEIDQLLAVYSIPRISQIQLIFRARLLSDAVSPGPETLEIKLCREAEVPREDLAFPSVSWALRDYFELRDAEVVAPRFNPPGETGDQI